MLSKDFRSILDDFLSDACQEGIDRHSIILLLETCVARKNLEVACEKSGMGMDMGVHYMNLFRQYTRDRKKRRVYGMPVGHWRYLKHVADSAPSISYRHLENKLKEKFVDWSIPTKELMVILSKHYTFRLINRPLKTPPLYYLPTQNTWLGLLLSEEAIQMRRNCVFVDHYQFRTNEVNYRNLSHSPSIDTEPMVNLHFSVCVAMSYVDGICHISLTPAMPQSTRFGHYQLKEMIEKHAVGVTENLKKENDVYFIMDSHIHYLSKEVRSIYESRGPVIHMTSHNTMNPLKSLWKHISLNIPRTRLESASDLMDRFTLLLNQMDVVQCRRWIDLSIGQLKEIKGEYIPT
ncbi:hypothetical protein BDB01DRAFT_472314 [Pilobolus umbonatus]|nr:hypothetical protein BDB01DRAFT_472314 [Pilobolus umbonatus]